MADVSDVMTVLAQIAEEAIYPNGVGQPSITGSPVDIYTGWPISNVLEEALEQGRSHVSVFPNTGEKNITFFQRVPEVQSIDNASVSAQISGNNIELSGSPIPGQIIVITVNHEPYEYEIQAGDDIDTILTAFFAIIPNSQVFGNTLIIDNAYEIVFAISVGASVITEIGRQERLFMITVWAPTPESRTILGSALMNAYVLPVRIVLPDNFFALLTYKSTREEDHLEKSRIYRRDLNFMVNYATTVVNTTRTLSRIDANITRVNQLEAH